MSDKNQILWEGLPGPNKVSGQDHTDSSEVLWEGLTGPNAVGENAQAGRSREIGADAVGETSFAAGSRSHRSRSDVPPGDASVIPRNSGIDLLRGLSILLVVLHHIGLRIPLRKTALGAVLPKWFLNGLNYNGYESVFVFFTISGFLIAGHALRRWGALGQIDTKAFYARRFARIVPCLLLLVLVLSVLHLFGFEDYLIKHANQSLPRAIFAALGLHLNWYEGHTGYLPGNWDVLWSLSIEEVFYIGFPIVCLLTRRTAILVPLLIAFALSLPFTHAALVDNEIWQEKAYLPGMAAIAMGVLAAIIAARCKMPRHGFSTLLCIVGALGFASILFIEDTLWNTLKDGCLLLLTLSIACLLVGLQWREQMAASKPLAGFGWLRSFGRLSYEIYLTHMFVVYAAVRLYKSWGSDKPDGWMWYLPVVLLCWILGWTVARFYSTPADEALRARLLPTPFLAKQGRVGEGLSVN
jgi:peptidoglycan/LPS O-acetylase OafA/YrhL